MAEGQVIEETASENEILIVSRLGFQLLPEIWFCSLTFSSVSVRPTLKIKKKKISNDQYILETK